MSNASCTEHGTKSIGASILLASSSIDSPNFFVTIENRLTEIQRQLSPLDLKMHEPSMFIRNKQLSSAESISQESAFEI